MTAMRARPRTAPEHRADAAVEAGAAQHRRRHHVELAPDQRGRRHRLRVLRLHDGGEPGHEAHVAVDHQVEAEHVEADAPRGLRIAAEREDLAAEGGAVQQEPGEHEGGHQADDLQVDAYSVPSASVRTGMSGPWRTSPAG